MDAPVVPLTVAFVAGLVSFLSPCVLPIVPSYVTFITGMSLDELTGEDVAVRDGARRAILVHGTLFVFGFSAVNIALGVGASFIGSLFFFASEWLARIGGALLIVFGLYLLGAVRIPSLNREWRLHLGDQPLGYLGTVMVGVTFAAAWTPCTGPVLGSIMTLAGSTGSIGQGVGLLAVYSLGLAVPFMLAAIFLQRFIGGLRQIGPWLPWVSRVSGSLLLVIGILLVSGSFTLLTAVLNDITPAFIRDRL